MIFGWNWLLPSVNIRAVTPVRISNLPKGKAHKTWCEERILAIRQSVKSIWTAEESDTLAKRKAELTLQEIWIDDFICMIYNFNSNLIIIIFTSFSRCNYRIIIWFIIIIIILFHRNLNTPYWIHFINIKLWETFPHGPIDWIEYKYRAPMVYCGMWFDRVSTE